MKYFIDKLKPPSDTRDTYTAKISCSTHYHCITIHGSMDECTDRVIKIIEALNRE